MSESSVGVGAKDGEKEVEAYGMTIPLLTTSNGEKFGKSAGNAVWLDERRTGISDFYQVSGWLCLIMSKGDWMENKKDQGSPTVIGWE
jgi:hypothetical protein